MAIFNQKPTEGAEHLYAARTLAQVRLLMEHLSALKDRKLADLTINNKGIDLQGAFLLDRIHQISDKITGSTQVLTIDDRVTLQLTRDALSAAVKPATGQTVAYTALVVRPFFSGSKSNRSIFAYDAYPDLRYRALLHKASRIVLLALAITLTSIVVWLSTEVAIGKHLLQTVGDLRARQATVALEEQQVETALDKLEGKAVTPADFTTGVPISTVRLCDRTLFYAERARQTRADIPRNADGTEIQLRSPSERAVCGEDEILRSDFQIAHQDIETWLRDWPSLVGGPLGWIWSAMPGHHRSQDESAAQVRLAAVSQPNVPKDLSAAVNHALTMENAGTSTGNIELHVAPRILAIGNYILPVAFGIIGSLIYVLMEFSAKVKDSLLEPRDGWLSWIRLVLGLVVGTCIGLFFTSYGPVGTREASAATGSDLISSLTLSASGLAFLAGFGVEGVFNMLQDLVRRVFPTDANGRAN